MKPTWSATAAQIWYIETLPTTTILAELNSTGRKTETSETVSGFQGLPLCCNDVRQSPNSTTPCVSVLPGSMLPSSEKTALGRDLSNSGRISHQRVNCSGPRRDGKTQAVNDAWLPTTLQAQEHDSRFSAANFQHLTSIKHIQPSKMLKTLKWRSGPIHFPALRYRGCVTNSPR